MFTGIIEECGTVLEADRGSLRIAASQILKDVQLGDSIAINGVDLTVASFANDHFTANVMPETYRRSNLGRLGVGVKVNLERSVRPTDRLSGHIVRGVVEGTAQLTSIIPEEDALIATYNASEELLSHMIIKGPICIDGVSLTITGKTKESFSVSLVQYTQNHTNLLDRNTGDEVNIETDILGRYVAELIVHQNSETGK